MQCAAVSRSLRSSDDIYFDQLPGAELNRGRSAQGALLERHLLAVRTPLKTTSSTLITTPLST